MLLAVRCGARGVGRRRQAARRDRAVRRVGVAAADTRHDAGPAAALPSLVGAGLGALPLLLRLAAGGGPGPARRGDGPRGDRRRAGGAGPGAGTAARSGRRFAARSGLGCGPPDAVAAGPGRAGAGGGSDGGRGRRGRGTRRRRAAADLAGRSPRPQAVVLPRRGQRRARGAGRRGAGARASSPYVTSNSGLLPDRHRAGACRRSTRRPGSCGSTGMVDNADRR